MRGYCCANIIDKERKQNGAKFESCGTPNRTGIGCDRASLNRTITVRSDNVKTPANSIIAPPNNSGLPTPFSEHFEASSTTNTIITGHVTQSRILPLYVDNFKTWHFHAGAVYNTGKGDFQARSYLRKTRFLKTTYARESKRNEVTSIPYGLMDQITEVTCMKQSLAPLIIPQHQDKGPHLDIWNCNGLLRHDHSSVNLSFSK
ncbi:hypothetical protein J6590_006926 [Homalodisca vitripennis]|nr:hypothetical protein J6590_006926 [Homalodisca vitripennis]